MRCKTVTILLRIRDRGHFLMSITRNHESHYVTALENPHVSTVGPSSQLHNMSVCLSVCLYSEHKNGSLVPKTQSFQDKGPTFMPAQSLTKNRIDLTLKARRRCHLFNEL